MESLKKFQLKMERREELRNQIYAVCYHYLNPKCEELLSPDVLLNIDGYDLNELSAPELIHKAGDAVGLPPEIIYLEFPYLDYFECSDPAPLSIMKFADILIEITEIYQTQWQQFKERPQEEQVVYYTKIYYIIAKYLPLYDVVFSPDMFMNVGGYGIRGRIAKEMVKRVAVVMGLNKSIYGAFDTYFNFPIKWWEMLLYVLWGIVFCMIVFFCLIVYLILYSFKWIITGKWHFTLPPVDTLEPLTAKEFADKIIGIWLVERFYQNNKPKGN